MATTGLDPVLADKMQQLQDLAAQEGIPIRITQGYRTPEEQERLYAQGRTTPGQIVTYAKPGSSRHQHGAAFDVVPLKGDQPDWNSPHWDRLGQLGKSLGLRWGGDFQRLKDRPHFELAEGGSPARLERRGAPDERALLTRLIQLTAYKAGVDPKLAVAVATQESSLDPHKVGDNGKSLGLFQLQEAAAIDAGIDPARRGETVENIRGGIRYLKQGLDRFGGDPRQALERHYNRGGDPDYYAHVMQYYPGGQPPTTRQRPGLLARVGRALSPASAEAATMPTGTERQALEQRLQAIQARKAQLGTTPAPSPAPATPPYEVDVQVLGPPGTAAAQGLGPAPTAAVPTADTQMALLGQQEQGRLEAERAVGSPTRPVTGSLLAPFRQGVQQFFAPVPPEAVPQTTDVVSQWMPGFEFLNVLPRSTQEQIVAEAPPAGRTAAATGITTALTAAGTATGGPWGGVIGSGLGYGVNVALGLEDPSLLGAGLSVGLPAGQAAAPLARRAVAAGTRWSRAGQAIQQADEAARTAQQTYEEGVQTAAQQTAQQRARAVAKQQADEAAYQQRVQKQQAEAQAAHEAREAERAAAAAESQAQAVQKATAKTQEQAQEYAAQLQRYEQAVASQRQAVPQARAVPQRVTPETPAHVLYKKVAEIAPEAPVTLTRTQEVAAELQDVLQQVPSLQPSRLQALLTDMRAARSTQSVKEVQRYLTDLGTLTRSTDSATRRTAKQLYGALHEDLAESAARLPETEAARELLLQANTTFRREMAARDLSRVVGRAITVGDDGIPRLAPGRLLTQFDRLVEEDRFFAGSFTPEELTRLRGELAGLTTAQKIPPRPGAAPAPVQPTPVEPFTPTPFQPPAPLARRAPYTTWKPDVAGPAPPEAVVPTMPPQSALAKSVRTVLRGAGVLDAIVGGPGPLTTLAGADAVAEVVGHLLLRQEGQRYLRALLKADGTVNTAALIALAGGRAALERETRGTATPQEAQQAVGTLRQRYAP